MCAALGRAHEFFLALKKAGLNDEIIKEVINSKDNEKAKKMLAAISAEPVKKDSTKNVQNEALILSYVFSFTVIPANTEKFVAKDNFIVDTSNNAKVKISYLGDNFNEWFLKKAEEPFPGSTIYGRELNKNSVNSPVLAELGGHEKAETTLTELYTAMKVQPNGEKGALLNNGFANIFYVRDINNILRAVYVLWDGDGWIVGACSVEGPDAWDAGFLVFSRNS